MIVCVNIEKEIITKLNNLSNEKKGIRYALSRSEIVRLALREYLKKKLPIAIQILKIDGVQQKENMNNNYVRVPITKQNSKESKNYKEYKIIKKLK
jgi:metal-responsive CopG/Arc/MetJ family transcriptional regulator